MVISALCAGPAGGKLTQGKIAELTGFTQGRLSEWRTGKREPKHASTFQQFADGIGMPSAARRALGLAGDTATAALAAPASAPLLLPYEDSQAQAARNVSQLWFADLDDASALQHGRTDPRAWNDASLKWLVGSGGQVPGNEPARGARIGMSDVERFRATVDMFAGLDDRYGGGHARSALIQYLSTDAERMLNGRYSDETGRALFSAVSEATRLAAWMSYDSAPASALAQGYFVQALALAQVGDDRLLGASVLDSMSHQATFTGRFSEAANLARAALTGTRGIATPSLTAHFHMMEARALARLGDAKAAGHALSEGEREFGRGSPENNPSWFQYFDDSELSAEFGHCMRDIGQSAEAVRYAGNSLGLDGNPEFARSDFFVSLVLADAHLASGDLEQACAVTLNALTSGEQIRSARCVSYLREFIRHLPATDNGMLRDFREQAANSRLWRIASQADKQPW
jgi:transcriptional regulator with XRE-family HTH domain